jgi:hypothetical protein
VAWTYKRHAVFEYVVGKMNHPLVMVGP